MFSGIRPSRVVGEPRGDRVVLRGIGDDRPYERIFHLKLWLALSLVGNIALVVWLASGR